MHKHDHDENSNDTISDNTSRKSACNNLQGADSPLRVALATNPLLTASLNSPPVHMAAAASSQALSIAANGSVDLSSQASSHLRKRQFLLSEQRCKDNNNEQLADRQASPDGHTSPCSSSTAASSASSKEMYANLLMQLRNQGITAAAAASSSEEHNHNHNIIVHTSSASAAAASSNNNHLKMSAAARKEKLKSQLCFQCPVCKKRFQRHIAMNAHFQAEHLGITSKNDKVCKLCAFVGQDMSSIRHHLLVKHSIDLDTPTACLAEPDTGVGNPTSPSTGCVAGSRSGSSSPLPSSSSDKKSMGSLKHCFANNNNNSSSSPAVSIIRTSVVPKSESDGITSSSSRSSPALQSVANVVIHETSHGLLNLHHPIKQERRGVHEDQVEVAKDLSMKKTVLPKRSASPAAANSSDCSSSSSSFHSSKKRHKTERVSQRIVISSSPSSPPPMQSNNDSSLVLPPQLNTSQWQCPHCNIIFPDQTLYFLHRGFHSNTNPWKCNGCGQRCTDMYDFNTHLMSDVHH